VSRRSAPPPRQLSLIEQPDAASADTVDKVVTEAGQEHRPGRAMADSPRHALITGAGPIGMLAAMIGVRHRRGGPGSSNPKISR